MVIKSPVTPILSLPKTPENLISTADFCLAHNEDIRTGTIKIPVFKWARENDPTPIEIIETPLNRKTAIRYHASVLAVIEDARKICRNLGAKARRKLPYSLPATEKEWKLIYYAENKIPDLSKGGRLSKYPLNDNFIGRIGIGNSVGRIIEIDVTPSSSDYKVGVGLRGIDAVASQFVSVKRHNKVMTEKYCFEFSGAGLKGLRDSLGLSRAHPYEVALEIARRIYVCEQYAPAEMADMEMSNGEESYDLEYNRERFVLPGKLKLGAEPFEINFCPKEEEPVVTIEGGLEDGDDCRSEYLSIELRRPTIRVYPLLMPLQPYLRETLWEQSRLTIAAEQEIQG